MLVTVDEGADKRLFCQVRNQGHRVSVYWQKNNVTLQPADDPRIRIRPYRYLKIKKARKEDAGLYTCVAENDCGGKNSVSMRLDVVSAIIEPPEGLESE